MLASIPAAVTREEVVDWLEERLGRYVQVTTLSTALQCRPWRLETAEAKDRVELDRVRREPCLPVVEVDERDEGRARGPQGES